MNERPHDLSALFRTGERITLLRAALNVPACTVQQITSKTGLSKGLVSPYLALLEREGLLKKTDRTYRLTFSPLTVAVKRLLNIDLVSAVFKKPAWASGIGMYGSWAGGMNTEESDIDLYIETTNRQSAKALIVRYESCISRKISPIIVLPDEARQLRTRDRPLFERIQSGKILVGEQL